MSILWHCDFLILCVYNTELRQWTSWSVRGHCSVSSVKTLPLSLSLSISMSLYSISLSVFVSQYLSVFLTLCVHHTELHQWTSWSPRGQCSVSCGQTFPVSDSVFVSVLVIYIPVSLYFSVSVSLTLRTPLRAAPVDIVVSAGSVQRQLWSRRGHGGADVQGRAGWAFCFKHWLILYNNILCWDVYSFYMVVIRGRFS